MKIDDYFALPMSTEFNAQGVESDWVDLCILQIKSGVLSVGDCTLFPNSQIEFDVELGEYVTQAKVRDFGTDRRICRLRAVLPTFSCVSQYVDEISVAFARVGLCDKPIFLMALKSCCDTDLEQYKKRYGNILNFPFGVIDLEESPSARMAFVSSGWGDGGYKVYRLECESRIVGAEVIFIDDEAYLFADAELFDIISGEESKHDQ